MAWNPSPEVAVARDAAKRLDDSDQCIIIYINYRTRGGQGGVGMATYGRTKALCDETKRLGNMAFDAVMAGLES